MADLGTYDLAVVGAGAAGLWSALRAAEAGGSVVLISRKPLAESASFHAQGGLAAALDPDDRSSISPTRSPPGATSAAIPPSRS